MSSTSKILTIIFSILLLGVLTFALCWGAINFKKVEEGLSGSSLYTEEDLEQSYQDGYNQALENEEDYLLIINEYKDTITKLNDTISQLNTTNDGYKKLISDQEKSIANLTQIKTENENSINLLNSTISENNKTIESLNAEKISLQTQVTNLTNEKTNNELTISSLNSQILSLQKQVDNLTTSSEDKSEEILNLNFKINELQSQVTILANENADLDSQISSLNSQIKSLQSLNDRLQDTNESNLNTITTLNNQIKSLNSQIIELSNQLQNNTSNVTTLNNKIAELEKSISYYEQYIASLENGEQVVATFEFNGSVYNIQIINKNSNVSVVAPISTEYVIFNGWTVNGESVDLSTYQITANTKFVADITYKYDVKFMIDGELYNSQIVEKNKHVTLPDIPTKDGYEFDGWSLNGVDVVENISSTAVTQNVTYQAVFTKLHTVTFMYEEELKSTQQVRNGEYATNVEVENTTYKVFNGWKVNGSFVDIASYKINADTIFVADVTYKYDVKFKVDNIDYDSQVVIENGYATLPEEPTKTGYEFDGWSLNGVDVVENISSTAVTQNITYQAVFTKLHTVSFMSNDKIISTQEVRNGEYAYDVAISDTELQLFNGWKLNSIFVNLETHKIFMDTIFVADFIDKVGLFKNGEQVYTWEELIENGYINVTDLLIKPTEKTTSIDGDLYFPNEAFTIGNNAFKIKFILVLFIIVLDWK